MITQLRRDAVSTRQPRSLLVVLMAIASLTIPAPSALAGENPNNQPTAQSKVSPQIATPVNAPNAYQTITNDRFYTDTDGNTIYSQGGGIFDFTDPRTGELTHYWYGVHYQEAEIYAANPVSPSPVNHFKSIDVYSSKDLVNWKNEGTALDYNQANSFSREFGNRDVAWVGRMGVAYISGLNKYALFAQHEMPTDNSGRNFDKKVLIATSNSPLGPFVADRRISMNDYGLGTTNTGDQTVFQDDDGTGYLVYSYGSGRSSMWVAQIGAVNGRVDLLNPTKIYQGRGREGNTMFKSHGKYYAAASDLFGWDGSRIHYLIADNIYGPYTPTNSMKIMDGSQADFAHISQTGFYYTVHGSRQETVIHMGDRWSDFAGNGLGYNQWDPIAIDNDGTPHFVSMNQWQLNARTGEWKVGAQNDYVLNGGFEADRVKVGINGYKDKDNRTIPDLAGWTRTNPSAVYNNVDTANRVGDYNLEFKDTTAYQAKIEQSIAPNRFTIPDGEYTLSAKHMSIADLADAKIYADSGGRHFETSLGFSTNGRWRNDSLTIIVSGGSVTVGVSVNGAADDLLRVDDISLKASPRSPSIDKTNLNKVIEQARQLSANRYTAQSWAVLTNSLDTATAMSSNTQASQNDVNQAQAALQSAINNLQNRPDFVDKSPLEQMLRAAAKKTQRLYTADSWESFTKAKEVAQNVYDNDQSTQQQVNDAKTSLTNAMNSLKLNDPAINKSSESGPIDPRNTNPPNIPNKPNRDIPAPSDEPPMQHPTPHKPSTDTDPSGKTTVHTTNSGAKKYKTRKAQLSQTGASATPFAVLSMTLVVMASLIIIARKHWSNKPTKQCD
jgi:hypothetical protein